MIQNNYIRWIISLIISTIITLALFWFMQYMIHTDENTFNDKEEYKMMDFIQISRESLVPEIKKELPPEPEAPKTPPKVLSEVESKVSTTPVAQTPLELAMPSLEGNVNIAHGSPKAMAPIKIAKMDSELTPMMQIKPIYPSKAKRMGTEGYVTVNIQVDETGHVTDIKIIDSVPKGVFDKSVKKALKKWKFRPKTVDGKSVTQNGSLKLNFTLGDE